MRNTPLSRLASVERRSAGHRCASACRPPFAAVVLLVGAALSLLAPAIRAVQPYTPHIPDPLLDAWRWHKVNELEGAGPQALIESADGAMWFAVSDAVRRYDGTTWQTFTAKDGLPSAVDAFYVGPDGKLYAGGAAGISRFEDGTWRRIFEGSRETRTAISSIAVTKDGTVWAAADRALVRIADGQVQLFTSPSNRSRLKKQCPTATVLPLPANLDAQGFTAAYLTRDETLWIGGSHGELIRLDPAHFSDPAAWHAFGESDGYFNIIGRNTFCETAEGVLWVGGTQSQGGANRYDPASGRWTHFDFARLIGADGAVQSIVQTPDGTVWFGGLGQIVRLKGDQWHVYTAPELPLTTSRISLVASRAGELWVLGVGDDVQHLAYVSQRWVRYDGLNYECETPDGRKWFIAADDGVVTFDGRQWLRYGTDDGLMRSASAVYATHNGQVWVVGTENGKVVTAWQTPSGWRSRVHDGYTPKMASIIDYRAVFEAKDGTLWFGSYVNGRPYGSQEGGVLEYDPKLGPPDTAKAWTRHLIPTLRYSAGIVQTADGTIYSAHGDLCRYDGHEWDVAPFYRKKNVDALCTTPDGDLWIGTRGDGVFFFGNGLTRHFTTDDGLKANAITALFCTRENHLWVGTSTGISQFDGKEWTTDVFVEARLTIGVEGGGFKESSDGALWINQSSRNWMRRTLPEVNETALARRGFSTIRYLPERVQPAVAFFTKVTRVSQPGNTVLAWDGSTPWGRTKEADLRYSHHLDGGAWSQFDAETHEVLLQLAPGPHRFEVRVRDRDFNVSAPAAIEFNVLPPVWQEPWFITLIAVLTAAIATQTTRVYFRGRRLRRSNHALATEIEEHKRTEAALAVEIETRKRTEAEVERTHKQLLLASREAGMAEVATSVLHNVGNVLNSVNVSASVVGEKLHQLKTASLAKTAALLDENAGHPGFLSTDPKGKQVPLYLRNLGEHMAETQKTALEELASLQKNIGHIREIVSMQQTYSRLGGIAEKTKVTEIVEDALRMNAAALLRHGVELERDYRIDPTIEVEKHKVLQILVNVIRNAKYACEDSEEAGKRITVRITAGEPGRIRIQVADNGIGIPAENLNRIFTHGFTTRKDGHGYGLHSSATAAHELGGTLLAESPGRGRGATFTLDLPEQPPEPRSHA